MNVQKFIEQEVSAKVETPTEEEVRLVYDGARDRFGTTPEDVALIQIRSNLILERTARQKALLLRELRKASPVTVALIPPRLKVDPGGAPSLGQADAPVSIIEFSDFECPFCARAATTIRTVLDKYPRGVRVAFRHFPLAMHHNALNASKAAFCASKQNKFWEMHDRLFGNASKLSLDDLTTYAREIGIESKAFESCFNSDDAEVAVKLDLETGRSYGVTGTPTLFVNGRFVNGAVPLATLTSIIDDEIERSSKNP